MNHTTMRCLTRFIFSLGIGLLAMISAASAQRFQTTFGGMAAEAGRGGVRPLNGGGGYICAGFSNSFGNNMDVYVVKSNLAGGIVWANAYNFGGDDFGYDIQETVAGDFIVTGVTNAGGNNDMFILKLNAAGAVIWAETFGAGNEDWGWDILQAGNGDYVAAGWSFTAAGNQDALIVRTNPAGGVIYAQTYAPAGGGGNEFFHGLFQAGNGDLLACGGTTSFGAGQQGLVMRINFATGAPIWANQIGGAVNEVFHSVIELTVGAQAGNIVAAGFTSTIAPLDFYVAKYNGAGGFIGPDISGGTAGGAEEMFQVRESKVLNPGNLLLTGRINPGPLGGDDGYVVQMVPAWGCPVGKVWSMAYGGGGLDQLYSGNEDPLNCIPGYILCGLTATPAFLPAGDPQQVYEIKTNNVGQSGCNELPPADRCTQPNYPNAAVALANVTHAWGVFWNVNRIPGNVLRVLCFTPCPAPPVGAHLSDGSDGISSDNSSVSSAPDDARIADRAATYPTPVAAGESFRVDYTLGRGREVAVVVSDVSGHVVYQRREETGAGNGSMTIGTDGWASGSYLVRVDLGSETQTRRIVVMDR
ncbi:MAG: T9SS type A sorting domain-containing protein [Bacteroidota bacterium]